MRPHSRAVRAALLAACTASPACSRGDEGAAPTLLFHNDTASASFGAVDLVAADDVLRALEGRAREDGWHAVLSVRTEGAGPDDPSVLGDHIVADGRLRFQPRFPPVRGQGYRIHVDASTPGAAGIVFDTLVRVERPARPPGTHVMRIHPAADRLPANLLRLYIEFSAAMSVGEAHERIRLLDGDGALVEDALLVVPQELWNAARTRLTVLFDPGRIKLGLRPNRERGPPLSPGGTYTLVIDDAWSDADGLPLREGYRHTFTAEAADRDVPRPTDWRIEPPGAGTRKPLVVTFDERLDWGLLHRLLTVHAASGEAVDGSIAVAGDGSSWTFTPAPPWQAGGYIVRARTDLEDLAGNSLRAPFDRDRDDASQPAETAETVDLPFVVR